MRALVRWDVTGLLSSNRFEHHSQISRHWGLQSASAKDKVTLTGSAANDSATSSQSIGGLTLQQEGHVPQRECGARMPRSSGETQLPFDESSKDRGYRQYAALRLRFSCIAATILSSLVRTNELDARYTTAWVRREAPTLNLEAPARTLTASEHLSNNTNTRLTRA